MKKLIISLAIVLASLAVNAQSIKKDAQGNYIAVRDTTKKMNVNAKLTGKTFTDLKGVKYPVFISKNNKLFYIKTSKAGNQYNVYIKN